MPTVGAQKSGLPVQVHRQLTKHLLQTPSPVFQIQQLVEEELRTFCVEIHLSFGEQFVFGLA